MVLVDFGVKSIHFMVFDWFDDVHCLFGVCLNWWNSEWFCMLCKEIDFD